MPKVFITGHRGMVGSALVRAVEKNRPSWTLLLADRKQLDLLNQKDVEQHLEKPLSAIPDPFGKFKSFSEHNNNNAPSNSSGLPNLF